MITKTCTRCGTQKTLNLFYKRSDRLGDGFHSQCKDCFKLASKTKREKNPEQARLYNKQQSLKWRTKNPGCRLQLYWPGSSSKQCLENYNKLFQNQQGCCYICNRHQSEFRKALAVDHDANTGEVRGLLCLACNMAIGLLKHDVALLRKAIEYLDSRRPIVREIVNE